MFRDILNIPEVLFLIPVVYWWILTIFVYRENRYKGNDASGYGAVCIIWTGAYLWFFFPTIFELLLIIFIIIIFIVYLIQKL